MDIDDPGRGGASCCVAPSYAPSRAEVRPAHRDEYGTTLDCSRPHTAATVLSRIASVTNAVKKLKFSDPYELLLARYEISNARMFVGMLAVIILMGFVITGLIVYVRDVHAQNRWLQEHQVMWGFQQEDGSFASTERRPTSFVLRYARDAANNQYTYDYKNAETNFAFVLDMYDATEREKVRPKLDSIRARLQQGYSQTFVTLAPPRLVEKGATYEAQFDGELRAYVGTMGMTPVPRRITVVLAKVIPTEARREGLSVLRITDGPL